jgi:hypothetical protein
MDAEPWLEGLVGPDAGFIVRNELQLQALGEGAFWSQSLLILSLFPLGLLVAGMVVGALGSVLNNRSAENAKALVLSAMGLGLMLLTPAVMAWAALVTIQDEAVDLDQVVGVGLLAVLLVAAAPLGAMARGKRIHGKAPLAALISPLVFPVVAVFQYLRVLAAPDASGAGLVQVVYDVLVLAAGFAPAWLGLVAAGGLTAFGGVVLAPLSLQGVFEVLGALKDKLLT